MAGIQKQLGHQYTRRMPGDLRQAIKPTAPKCRFQFFLALDLQSQVPTHETVDLPKETRV